MIETRKIECKRCRRLKIAYLSSRSESKHKKWETDGKFWNGKVCPKCVLLNMKQYQRVKRNSKLLNINA